MPKAPASKDKKNPSMARKLTPEKPARSKSKSAARKPNVKEREVRRSKRESGESPASKPKSPDVFSRFRVSALSPDRKLDIGGVILALLGFLTFLSLLSSQRSEFLQAWINALEKIFGWGIYFFPIALIGIGLWMVFRRVEHLPVITLERMVGIVLFAGESVNLAAPAGRRNHKNGPERPGRRKPGGDI